MMNEVVPFLVKPTTLTEAMSFCQMISNSDFCPKPMKGKPGDIFVCIQMGAEVGLNPMQAIQNIAVINGRPCIWGDAALALAQKCPDYEYHKEWYEGTIAEGTRIAYCLVKRKGSEEYTKSFSMDEAKKAALWSKQGPWTQYPDRMLQMRARSFAIRDQFADGLKGLAVREEVEDYAESKNKNNAIKQVEVAEVIEAPKLIINEPPYTIEQCVSEIQNATTMAVLRETFEKGWRVFEKYRGDRQIIKQFYDTRKAELEPKPEVVKNNDDFLNDPIPDFLR